MVAWTESKALNIAVDHFRKQIAAESAVLMKQTALLMKQTAVLLSQLCTLRLCMFMLCMFLFECVDCHCRCVFLSLFLIKLQELHRRIEPLVLFTIDGANAIDGADDMWELLLAVLKDEDGETACCVVSGDRSP